MSNKSEEPQTKKRTFAEISSIHAEKDTEVKSKKRLKRNVDIEQLAESSVEEECEEKTF